MTAFADPKVGGGDTLKPADVDGHLLICYPLSFEAGVTTDYGTSDAVRLNVADVDTGDLYRDVLWFPKLLVSSLRDNIAQPVLARMGQGTAKPGQSPPWVLNAATGDPAAVQAAEAWLAAHPGELSGMASPSTPAPAPQPAPTAPAPSAASLV